MSNPIISFLIIVLSLGFGFFYVKPAYDSAEGRRTDLTTLAETLKNSGEIQALVDQTANTMSGIDADKLTRFSVFLPETTDALRLANNIQHIALSHNITLDKVKVGDPSKAPLVQSTEGVNAGIAAAVSGVQAAAQKYATTRTVLAFKANDVAFGAFLGDIERSLGLMDVTMLSLIPVADTQGLKNVPSIPQYQYEIEVDTYSLN